MPRVHHKNDWILHAIVIGLILILFISINQCCRGDDGFAPLGNFYIKDGVTYRKVAFTERKRYKSSKYGGYYFYKNVTSYRYEPVAVEIEKEIKSDRDVGEIAAAIWEKGIKVKHEINRGVLVHEVAKEMSQVLQIPITIGGNPVQSSIGQYGNYAAAQQASSIFTTTQNFEAYNAELALKALEAYDASSKAVGATHADAIAGLQFLAVSGQQNDKEKQLALIESQRFRDFMDRFPALANAMKSTYIHQQTTTQQPATQAPIPPVAPVDPNTVPSGPGAAGGLARCVECHKGDSANAGLRLDAGTISKNNLGLSRLAIRLKSGIIDQATANKMALKYGRDTSEKPLKGMPLEGPALSRDAATDLIIKLEQMEE